MLAIFHSSGYRVSAEFDGEANHITFDLTRETAED
jgi:hypothetical protein